MTKERYSEEEWKSRLSESFRRWLSDYGHEKEHSTSAAFSISSLNPNIMKIVRDVGTVWGHSGIVVSPGFSTPTYKVDQPAYFQPLLPHMQVPEESRSEISDFERLAAQNKMLISLIGLENIKSRLEELFPYKLERKKINITFEHKEPVTIADYSKLFLNIDRIYKMLLTFIKIEYFITRWIKGEYPIFNDSDLIQISHIVKKSPGHIQGYALGEVAKNLSEVLSVGKQIEDIRMAGVRVKKAKIELEEKEMQLEALKQKQAIQGELIDLELDIERQKKRLEIEKLKTQIGEELRKRRKIFLEDIDQRFEVLSKGIKVLSEVPEEILSELKAGLNAEL